MPTTPRLRTCGSPRNTHQNASGKPGAVQPHGPAPGNRGGRRCLCAQLYAGVRTPDLRSHRLKLTQDWDNYAHTSDPCNTAAAVTAAAERLRTAGHGVGIVSMGSSPTARHARHLDGVTELRAGVYMFGDLFQAGIHTHGLDDIAVTVLASVIGRRVAEHRILVNASGLSSRGFLALCPSRILQPSASTRPP